MADTHTLLVVAKQPAPGKTKTRLCPPLTPSQASELYECFLRDTLDTMRRVPGVERQIGYLPDNAQVYFEQLAPDMRLLGQQGSSLGERLDNLLSTALQNGARRAVVMNSDSPTLPVAYLIQAFDLLAESDVVLGPTQDGGYYLIGLKEPRPFLLRQVKMSTPHVLQDTLRLAEAGGLKVLLLPAWYDVDTIADLQQLKNEIIRLGSKANGIATATRGWLSRTNLSFPEH